MKKLLALLLTTVMMLTLLPAAQADGGDYFTIQGFYPVVNEGENVTLRVAVYQGPDSGPAEDIWFWDFLREICHINVDVEQYTNRDEYKNLMFQTGDLPDLLVNMAVSTNQIVRYGMEEGMLLPLDMYAEYMPNMTKFYEENPEYHTPMLAPDGHQYSLGNIGNILDTSKLSRVFINQTWLKESGLETPTTLDEFVEMLRVFKQRDDCVVPMGGGNNAVNPGVALLAAFGYATTNGNGTAVCLRNGKVVIPYGDREVFGEYLKLMNMLYEEELISHDWYTLETTQVRAIASANQTGILAETPYASSPETWDNWYSMKPLTSQWSETPIWPGNTGYISSGVFCVSADTEYPELCAALADMFFDKDGVMYWIVGPHEDDPNRLDCSGWRVIDEYSNVECDDIINDTAGIYGNSFYQYRLKRTSPFNGYACGITNILNAHLAEVQGFEPKGGVGIFSDWENDADQNYQHSLWLEVVPYLVDMYPPIIFFDSETADRVSELNTLIGDFRATEVANFVTGRRPVTDEELTKYFDDLDNLGFQELLGYYVEYYDHYMAMQQQ